MNAPAAAVSPSVENAGTTTTGPRDKPLIAPRAYPLPDQVWSAWRNNLTRSHHERKREAFNYGMFDQTFNRGWLQDANEVKRLGAAGQNPISVNLTKQAINSISGQLINDGHIADYVSERGISPRVGALADALYERCYSNGGWDLVQNIFTRNGLIYRGFVEFFPDYSSNELGDVGLRGVLPERIITDADWVTDNLNDCRQIFTFTFMHVDELAWRYGDAKPAIRKAIEDLRAGNPIDGGSNEAPMGAFDPSIEYRDTINQTFMVITRYWLEQERYTRLYNTATGRYLDYVPEGERGRLARMQAEIGGPVVAIPSTRLIEHFSTICPALTTSETLIEGRYPLQLGGYHFVHFSSDHVNGHPNTFTDQIGEVNRRINLRETSIDSILGRFGMGQRYIEVGAAADDAEEKRYTREGNVPGAVFRFKAGARARQAFGNLEPSTPPTEFTRSSDRAVSFLKEGVAPSINPLSGISSPGDSGALIERSVTNAVISMVYAAGNLKAATKRIHQMFLAACRQIYTYPMVIGSRDGLDEFAVNMPAVEGSIDISALTMIDVDVRENPKSMTKRSQAAQEISTGMQYVQDPDMNTALAASLIQVLPNLPDKNRAVIEEIADNKLKVMLAKSKIELDQMMAQAQAPQQPMGQPAPQQGQPAPAPGAMAPQPE
jgi:hypothetical protein